MRRALLSALLATPALGLAALSSALARPPIDPSACTLRHTATTVASLLDLPRPIAQDLQSRLRPLVDLEAPAMADRGGPFRATDIITDSTVPSRRFIHAGRSGDLWLVWYEQGGRGYATHLVIYRIEADTAEPALHLAMQSDNLCAATDAALDSGIAPNAWPTESW
jgi:hypothetical protein